MNYLYRFIDYNNNIIYIGKTTQDLDTRMHQHWSKRGHLPKVCLDNVARIEVKPVDEMVNVEYIEKQLIQYLQPKYNTIWKNEKSDYIPQQHLEDWTTYKDIMPINIPQYETQLVPAINIPQEPYQWNWVDNLFVLINIILIIWMCYGFYNLFMFLSDKF